MTMRMYNNEGELVRTFSLDGAERKYYGNGQLERVKLTDGTTGRFQRNGLLTAVYLSDGTNLYFHDNGHLSSEGMPNGTSRSYYTDGQLQSVRQADGTSREYYKSGQLKQEQMAGGITRNYHKNKKLKSVTLSNNTHFTLYDNGTLETVDLSDGDGFSWGRSGTLSSASTSEHTYFFRGSNGQPKFAGIRLSSGKTYYVAQLSQEQINKLNQSAQILARRAEQVKQAITQYVQELSQGESYNQTSQHGQTETYHQIISEPAARKLDIAEGSTRRMDALKKAKNWDGASIPALEIWRNTGWDKGKNGVWKFDLQDGSLKKDLALRAVKQSGAIKATSTLGEVLDFPELFITFINNGEPDNAPFDDMGFKDHKLNGKTIPAGSFNYGTKDFEIIGSFDFDGTYLKPANNKNTILAVLHEVQHAIQDIEGWPHGSNLDIAIDSIPEVQKINARLNELREQRAHFTDNARATSKELDEIFGDTDFDRDVEHLYRVYSNIRKDIRGLEQEYSKLQEKEERLNNLLNASNLTQDDARDFDAELDRVFSNMDAITEDIQQKNMEAEELFSSSQLSGKQKSLARKAANIQEVLSRRQHSIDELNFEIDALEDELSRVVDNAYDDGTAMSLYVRDAGETEARNVMTRHGMTEQERRDTPLWATEDVPRSEQTELETYHQSIARTPRETDNSTETYHQPFLRAKHSEDEKFMDIEAFTLTPEAQKQIDAVRKKYQGTKQWLKAPNGKDTNLTEQQWLAVRTPNFKRWFGDWINDPLHASRVLDKNGEPLVVYHGTAKDRVFSVFHTRWQGGGKYQGTHQGAHFGTRNASIERIVNWYRHVHNLQNYVPNDWEANARQVGRIMPCFLNIRKLGRVQDQVTDWSKAINAAIKKGFDGFIYTNNYEDKGNDSYIVFEPAQIKSATRNNGEYSENPDVYKQIIGKKGAKRLDRINARNFTGNLEQAKEFETLGMPNFSIWRTTGWTRGADDQWRTEILDGNIRRQAFSEYPKRKTFVLQEIYDNEELYNAYPELRDIPVHIKKISKIEFGYYDSVDKNITINQTKLQTALQNQDYDYITSCLIHEIQHAVQELEGFDGGSSLDLSGRHAMKHFNRLMMSQPPNVQDKMRSAADSLYKDKDKAKFQTAIASMSAQEREVWEQLAEQYNRLEAAYDRYRRSTGEVEARNAQTRAKWDAAQRRSTILTRSEDTPRSKQIRTPR